MQNNLDDISHSSVGYKYSLAEYGVHVYVCHTTPMGQTLSKKRNGAKLPTVKSKLWQDDDDDDDDDDDAWV